MSGTFETFLTSVLVAYLEECRRLYNHFSEISC